MSLDRRAFLKTGLLAAGAAAAGSELPGAAAAPAAEDASPTLALSANGELIVVHRSSPATAMPTVAADVRRGVPGRKWVMVIDLAACDGCGNCRKACGQMHAIPADREWLRLYKLQDSPDTSPYWLPKPCFHCDNPPCTRVCPVGATFKRQDGVVLIDNTRCIGCRFCMAACPYSSRVFNWRRPASAAAPGHKSYSPEWGSPRRVGTVEKCDFCPDRAAQGKLPGCASECRMGAIYFGDENEDAVTNSRGETLRLSTMLRDRAGYRYLEELGTQPRVYYLPPSQRRYAAPPSGSE